MDIDSKNSSVNTTIEEALKKFKQELMSGAITIKTKTTKPSKGGNKKRGDSQGGKNTARVNKAAPKKQKKKGGR